MSTTLPVVAHEGGHAPDMLARVESAIVSGDEVVVVLTVTGFGGPLVLIGMSAAGAMAPIMDPVYVNFAQDVQVQTALRFVGPPPGIFTLNLDFGPVGQGAVTVIPTVGASN
ncbi:MAG: hypothetical protein AAF214_03635 [Pseudomonadota bacterium]